MTTTQDPTPVGPTFPLWLHLLPWLTVPTVELVISRNLRPRQELTQVLVEFGAFAALGALQWRFAKAPWLRTPIWPALLLVLLSLAMTGPRLPIHWLIFYVAGIVLLATSVLKDLDHRIVVHPVVGAVVAACFVLAGRASAIGHGFASMADLFSAGSGVRPQLASEWLGNPAPAPSTAKGPAVIFISVDTLRADRAASMASWQRLAERGRAYPSAMSTSSWTMPAVASMQTGAMPADHGAVCLRGSQCQAISIEVPTLAEQLRGAGYATAAVTSNPWLTRQMGFSRGFDSYIDLAGVPPFQMAITGLPWGEQPQDDSVAVDEALRWLESAPERGFYLWVHLIGPHMPYTHTPEFASIEGSNLRNGAPPTPSLAAALVEAYDVEVAYTDVQIVRLLDWLDATGRSDHTLVVLTSDHGEEFWEHQGVEHGHSHHSEVVDVPLVLAGPGVTRGKGTGVASLVDIAPTLLATAGIDHEGYDLRGELPDTRVVTAWGNLYAHMQRSGRDLTRRVIVSEDFDGEVAEVEAYDVVNDPGERTPLPSINHPVDHAVLGVEAPEAGEAAELQEAALRALGYLGD